MPYPFPWTAQSVRTSHAATRRGTWILIRLTRQGTASSKLCRSARLRCVSFMVRWRNHHSYLLHTVVRHDRVYEENVLRNGYSLRLTDHCHLFPLPYYAHCDDDSPPPTLARRSSLLYSSRWEPVPRVQPSFGRSKPWHSRAGNRQLSDKRPKTCVDLPVFTLSKNFLVCSSWGARA